MCRARETLIPCLKAYNVYSSRILQGMSGEFLCSLLVLEGCPWHLDGDGNGGPLCHVQLQLPTRTRWVLSAWVV